MRSFTIVFRAVLSGLAFLPFEAYSYLKESSAPRRSFKIIISIVTLALVIGFISLSNWEAETLKAKIKFDIGGPFGTVHGSFSGLKTTIVFNENDLAGSSILASIQAATIGTGIGLRNRDLRDKEEWLNSKKYPMISFHSVKIEKTGTGYKAIGNLMMKNTTKAVEIPFTFNANGNSGLFKGRFDIKRSDFNVGKEGGSVAAIMTITLEVPVKK
ncbi:MAG TPA: YceI family protein [Puia sp.]|jgi:polyisoprenoid-binding protein YceI|nr:YceI family protein [Puia sp.]